MERENKLLEELLAGCGERDRGAVVNSYPGRLLDADGLELATVRACPEDPVPKRYTLWLDTPCTVDSLRELNPTTLVVWDHPSKRVYPIVRLDRCLGGHPHFHAVV